jgi:hypothetical protein
VPAVAPKPAPSASAGVSAATGNDSKGRT